MYRIRLEEFASETLSSRMKRCLYTVYPFEAVDIYAAEFFKAVNAPFSPILISCINKITYNFLNYMINF